MGRVMLSLFLTGNQILLLVCKYNKNIFFSLQMKVLAAVTGYISCPYKVLERSWIL